MSTKLNEGLIALAASARRHNLSIADFIARGAAPVIIGAALGAAAVPSKAAPQQVQHSVAHPVVHAEAVRQATTGNINVNIQQNNGTASARWAAERQAHARWLQAMQSSGVVIGVQANLGQPMAAQSYGYPTTQQSSQFQQPYQQQYQQQSPYPPGVSSQVTTPAQAAALIDAFAPDAAISVMTLAQVDAKERELQGNYASMGQAMTRISVKDQALVAQIRHMDECVAQGAVCNSMDAPQDAFSGQRRAVLMREHDQAVVDYEFWQKKQHSVEKTYHLLEARRKVLTNGSGMAYQEHLLGVPGGADALPSASVPYVPAPADEYGTTVAVRP